MISAGKRCRRYSAGGEVPGLTASCYRATGLNLTIPWRPPPPHRQPAPRGRGPSPLLASRASLPSAARGRWHNPPRGAPCTPTLPPPCRLACLASVRHRRDRPLPPPQPPTPVDSVPREERQSPLSLLHHNVPDPVATYAPRLCDGKQDQPLGLPADLNLGRDLQRPQVDHGHRVRPGD